MATAAAAAEGAANKHKAEAAALRDELAVMEAARDSAIRDAETARSALERQKSASATAAERHSEEVALLEASLEEERQQRRKAVIRTLSHSQSEFESGMFSVRQNGGEGAGVDGASGTQQRSVEGVSRERELARSQSDLMLSLGDLDRPARRHVSETDAMGADLVKRLRSQLDL